ncbi:chemotaxis-specific protein-glutamate methyltransferase CheB [Leptospira fluminis]|uniref:Protein-glutamate methylesterase/protein-glutamine glutaminase n=1 Tax=Leptospira fluminis TaxID=2484979 RepID=A0A4V3JEP5_9LEPT|nr:chemotaxis-specific protein-glutamate methyltransferase CheB [Leptospira fluminis]TGK20125.1 chemotaxis-specific protein-glutamate methyltransferase CheB [Leptospira fluminis]
MEDSLEKKRITVLAVDDSLVYRNLLRSAFSQDPEIEFLGAAIDGKFALPKIAHLKPDFVVLDVEMPEMDGLTTLREIRIQFPETKVIMLSSLTMDGAKVTLKAMEMGALDFVSKPDGVTAGAEKISEALSSLIEKVKALHSKNGINKPVHVVHRQNEISFRPPKRKYSICAVGISTGGPIALRELLSKIPSDLNGTIVIAQHMPPVFTNYLAENLSSCTALGIKEVEDGELLKKRAVYIAPGGKQLEIMQSPEGPVAKVTAGPQEELCKPSVNILFNSIAKNFSNESIGVIMTGMGEDGYLGLKAMREKGSFLLAQNQESCLVFGMPSRPIKEGLIDEISDITGIAEKISALMG